MRPPAMFSLFGVNHLAQSPPLPQREDACHMCPEASAVYRHLAMRVEVKLDPDPASVREARVFVETNLRGFGFPESVDIGVLIMSELATNALRYAADAPFLVVVGVDSEHNPVIEVHDSSLNEPELLPADCVSEGERGLHVVDALCEVWTCVPSGSGKAIAVTLDPQGSIRDRSAKSSELKDDRNVCDDDAI
jgi:histidine kinase-like protein